MIEPDASLIRTALIVLGMRLVWHLATLPAEEVRRSTRAARDIRPASGETHGYVAHPLPRREPQASPMGACVQGDGRRPCARCGAFLYPDQLDCRVCKRLAGRAAERWDGWWRDRLRRQWAAYHQSEEQFGYAGLLIRQGSRFVDPANSNELLVSAMDQYGLRSVLCVGNGISREPLALAAMGFAVTVLDVSGLVCRVAEARRSDPPARHPLLRSIERSPDPERCRPGGSVEFVVGDLLDTSICPGPFDVVIERRCVQVLPEDDRPAALSALTARLAEVGIIVCLRFDDAFPVELGWSQHWSGYFHASQSWFEERGWTIWDGIPGSTLSGQVAWLVRAGSAKPPPPTDEKPN